MKNIDTTFALYASAYTRFTTEACFRISILSTYIKLYNITKINNKTNQMKPMRKRLGKREKKLASSQEYL